MLFGLFNPVLDSMRGLCAASHLKRVQEDVCSRPVGLGSFSEVEGVFDPELLKQVFLELAGEIPTSWGDARLAHLADKLKLVDGTLLPALPCMEIPEELPQTAADRAAGVTWQGMVKHGDTNGRANPSAWSKSKWMARNCYSPRIWRLKRS